MIVSELVQAAQETVRAGYYRAGHDLRRAPSLVEAIAEARASQDPCVLVSLTPPRPTRGRAVEGGLAGLMQRSLDEGAVGFIVMTEPRFYGGSLSNLRRAVETRAPAFMKDVIVSESQIDCAATLGAAGVVLNPSYLSPFRLAQLADYARMAGREVLVECTSEDDVGAAIACRPDLVGLPEAIARDPAVARIVRGADPGRTRVAFGDFRDRSGLTRLLGSAEAIATGPSIMEGRVTVADLLSPSAKKEQRHSEKRRSLIKQRNR